MFSSLLPYIQLMRLNRPIGILLLLWPTLWALWLAADGMPPLKILVIFIAGTVLMRSAGCVINDFADRNFDGHVERTKNRPLVTGAANAKIALILFVCLCLLAFALVLFLNQFTILLAVAGVILAFCYPFTKRYFHLPQVVLGLAFAWAIPMAFTAVRNQLPVLAWLLFLATFFWVVAYDTQYAMSDKEDDLKIGIKSSAILFGRFDKVMVAVLQLCMLLLLTLFGFIAQLNWVYFLSLVIAAALFLYQYTLIRTRQRVLCFTAFVHNNWVGLVIFVGIFLSCLLQK